MSDVKEATNDTFLPHGGISPPGPVGRTVRILLGLGSIYIVYQISQISEPRAVTNEVVLAYVAFAIYLIGYVVNIGFGLRLGLLPRLSAVAILAAAGILGWQTEGTIESHALWQVMYWLMAYVYGHLGISFLFSALFATPGCEMRAIPAILGRLTGRRIREHHCPGPIRMVDKWESGASRRE